MIQPELTTLPSGRKVLDTGRVLIGLTAPPRAPALGQNAELIQRTLLGDRATPPGPLRLEREALAHAAGITFDLSHCTDAEVDEITAIAEAHAEGQRPFAPMSAGVLLGLIVIVSIALALWGGQ